MVDIIRTRRSATPATTPASLESGQLGVNIPDKMIWIGDTGNNPVLIYNGSDTGHHVSVDGNNVLINGTDVRAFWDGDYTDLINVPSEFPPIDHDHAGGDLPHVNTTGRDAADSHPAPAISYDNTDSGLGATDVKAALDEISDKQASGIVEYGAIVTPGGGDIWTDVNAFDWSGHAHASGTALSIAVNHVVTFGNNTATAYRWVGTKPVLIGLGGTYTTVEGDFLATATADHSALTNRTVAGSHPATAVSFNPATSDLTAIEVQAAIAEHANTKTGNPHDVTYGQLGGSQPAPLGHDHDGGTF